MESESLGGLLDVFMQDPMWRLTSGEVYKIIPNAKEGLIPYHPRPEHVEIFEALITEKRDQLMMLKARRPGFSTALGLFMLDFAIFTPGVQCSLVDQNAADATRKLEKIICVALDNLPEWMTHNPDGSKKLKVGAECGQGGKRSGEQLSLAYNEGLRSEIYAGMNARGGTNHFLHVSEWGVVQFEDEARSARIRSGALPSARGGIVAVETTWAGGKSGDVWELIEPVMNGESDDWKLIFCPWWRDPRNTDENAAMSPAAIKYFLKADPLLNDMGVVLTEGQKRWWAREKRLQGVFMPRENPSFLHECWEAPAPGSIYGDNIDILRSEGRFCPLPNMGNSFTHTFWDLGAPRQTRVIYLQLDGPWLNVVEIEPVMDETLKQRVARMKQKPYLYGNHYFPHDVMQTKTSGHTLATEFAAYWLQCEPELVGQWDPTTGKKDFTNDYRKVGIKFVPRTADEWIGINYMNELFPAVRVRNTEENKNGLDVLAMYRVPKVKEGGNDTGKPVHDFSSHLADAWRTMSESHKNGMIDGGIPAMKSRFNPWEQEDRSLRPRGMNILTGPHRGASHAYKR